MATAAYAQAAAEPVAIPVREAMPWVVFAGLLPLMALYFIGAE
ncbi:MAG: hypothetical protein U1E70_15295 [Acetobacteraceae bacterium]